MSVFALKVAMALTTYGSTDVLIFEADVMKMRRDGGLALYREGISTAWCGQIQQRACPAFNHPPFMIRLLGGWSFLSRISGLPFGFWLRFTCALADLGSLALLWRLLRGCPSEARARVALFSFAASPIAILISGFHGNTDPILVFLVLLTIDLAERQRPAWLAGIALGVASEIKVLPLLLAPAVLMSLSGTRRRLEFCVGAAAAFLAGSAPFLFAAPELVITRVFGYAPQSGTWGLALLALVARERTRLPWLGNLYVQHGRMLSLFAVAGATLWLRPLLRRHALFMPVGFLLFLFVSMIPGFGVQYLAWLVPWVVRLGSGPTAACFLVGTVFLVAYYSSTAGPFPWHVANSLEHPAWTGTVLALGLICWVVVCVITFAYARQLATMKAEPPRAG